MNITRKKFIKKTLSSFIGFYFINIFKPLQKIIAQNNYFNKSVIHIQGKDISKSTINRMISEGFRQLGGSKLIRPGMSVILKPNIGFSSSPERALTINPELVEAVARICIGAGAKS